MTSDKDKKLDNCPFCDSKAFNDYAAFPASASATCTNLDCNVSCIGMPDHVWNTRANNQNQQATQADAYCPMGDDCDLTIAYMKGVSDGKKQLERDLQTLRERLLNPSWEMIFMGGDLMSADINVDSPLTCNKFAKHMFKLMLSADPEVKRILEVK